MGGRRRRGGASTRKSGRKGTLAGILRDAGLSSDQLRDLL
jgi:hypothetical protein